MPFLCLQQTNADPSPPSTIDRDSLKITVTVAPNASRRGGIVTVTAKVERDGDLAQGAVAKILVTFSDNRQRSQATTSNGNGMITCIIKIPVGASTGSARVDVMIRYQGVIAIESSFFTVK